MGNLTADIIRTEYKTDFGYMNSGALRADRVYEKGVVNLRLIHQIYPMPDSFAVLEITGSIWKQILENGVKNWPNHDGKWPCISGSKFEWDSTRPQGDRIVSLTTHEGIPIEMD